jgi:hypothetical protein
VRAPSRLAFVAWFVVFAGGCAAVTGLNNISESDCEPNCGTDGQAKTDVTTDSPGVDSPGQDQASPETGPGPEGSTNETSTETSTGEAGKEGGGNEGGVDSPADSPKDVAAESPCGPTDTVTNCSACGDTCTATNASNPQCNGTTCSYTCTSGYLDCNASQAPDTDGCECHSPGATQANCGNGTNGALGCCPVQHNDGLNSGTPKFFDCNPAGSYSLGLAIDACTEFTGNAGQCTQGQCVGADGGTDGDLVVCSTGSTTDCPCWTFTGPNAGYVHDPHLPPSGGNNCFCADKTLGDTTYN